MILLIFNIIAQPLSYLLARFLEFENNKVIMSGTNRFGLPDILRVTFIPFPPYNIPYFVGDSLRVHGLYGSLLGNITNALNMTYKLILPYDGEYGLVFPNLTTSGQWKMVQENHVDIGLGPLIRDLNSYHIVHFTQATEYTDIRILSGMKKAYFNSPVELTSSFDEMTWLFLGVSSITLTLLLTLEHSLHYQQFSLRIVGSQFFTVLQTLFQEATKERFKRPATQILGGFFILATYILAIMFSNEGKANLIVQAPTLRYDTLKQALDNPKLIIYYPINTPIHGELLSLGGENGDRLRGRLNSEGALTIAQYYDEQRQNDLINRKAIILMDEQSEKSSISRWCSEPKNNDYYYIGTESLSYISGSIGLSKNLSKEFRKAFDKKVSWTIALGVKFLRNIELFPGHLGCVPRNTKRQADEMETLQLDAISYTFKILLIFLSLSIIIFFLEVAVHYFQHPQ